MQTTETILWRLSEPTNDGEYLVVGHDDYGYQVATSAFFDAEHRLWYVDGNREDLFPHRVQHWADMPLGPMPEA